MGKQGPKGPSKYTPEFINKEAKKLLEWVEAQDQNPFFLSSFAYDRGYCHQRLTEFAQKNENFSDSLKRAKTKQEANLSMMLVKRGGNTAGIIFALKNVAGWRDKQEITGAEGDPLQVQIIAPVKGILVD